MRRIPGVEVGVSPRYRRGLPECSRTTKEPQAVAQNRTAKGAVHIERVDERGWFQNPDRPQLVVDVVRARPLARPAVEGRPGERVASRARHEVHDGPAGFCLSQATRHEHLHFIDVGYVVGERRDAAPDPGSVTSRPLTEMRPSFCRPPCAVKRLIWPGYVSAPTPPVGISDAMLLMIPV